MGFPFFMFDSYYFILVVPAMLLALWAQINVSSTFAKYSKVTTYNKKTGAEAAEYVLRNSGVTGVTIERVNGNLTDHFDPRTNVIRLSDAVYSSTSIAAQGVAAHEAGHAVQHSEHYAPMKLRATIIPITQIGSNLAVPLIIMGVIFSFQPLVTFGIIAFGLAVVFQLITLPVEFNASRRALAALSQDTSMRSEEVHGAKKVLTAAALTYVAALIVAVANLLRLVLRFGGRNRD
jgi:Zn-dependent membrane protease YugP